MSSTLEPTLPPAEAEARSRPTDVQGLVDNATPDRLYGWAWNPAAPGERLTVELRLGETPVARTTADFARPDLAKAGVGDGCHAFELPLEPDWVRRRAELSVVARLADGSAAPIPMRVRRATPDLAANAAGLQRALEALAAGQNRLLEQVHGLAARLPGEEEREVLHGLVRAQADLGARLDTLSVWLTRLDERLAVGTEDSGPRRRRPDAWQAALFVLLAGVVGGAVLLGLHLGR